MIENNKKVSWNASQGIITEISNRRSYANGFFINGDIRKAINTLIAIKQSVIQSFNDSEREQLNKIEDKFGKISGFLYSSSGNSFNPEIREAYFLSRKIATKIYSEYNNLLMDLLESRGYLVGEQTDNSKMKF
jgi:hypothetical protein